MPKASLGPCVWYPQPGHEPSAGMIVQVGDRSVSVIVLSPYNRAGVIKDGVRHISDPDLSSKPTAVSAGCWDFTDDQKALRALQAELGTRAVDDHAD